MFHMEQKNYKLEIVKELLRNNNHVRGIAKKLDINHMTILRKIKELSKENVVDYEKQGKNKVYFLKKTIEAKNHVLTTENYKLTKTLKKYPNLRSIIKKIQKNKKIKLAILFGSYAKNIAKKESDIDVYIKTKNPNIKKEIQMINTKLNIKIGDFDLSSLLIKEIIKNHVIIKGVEEFYEKTRFFE